MKKNTKNWKPSSQLDKLNKKDKIKYQMVIENQNKNQFSVMGKDGSQPTKFDILCWLEREKEFALWLEHKRIEALELDKLTLDIKTKLQNSKKIIPVQKLWSVKLYDEVPSCEAEKMIVLNYSRMFEFTTDDEKLKFTKTKKEYEIEVKDWLFYIGYSWKLLRDLTKMYLKKYTPEQFNWEKNARKAGYQLDYLPLYKQARKNIWIKNTTKRKNKNVEKALDKLKKDSYNLFTDEYKFEKNLWSIQDITAIDELETGFYLSDKTKNYMLNLLVNTDLQYWLSKNYLKNQLKSSQYLEYIDTMWNDFSKLSDWIISPEPTPDVFAQQNYIEKSEIIQSLIDLHDDVKQKVKLTKSSNYSYKLVKIADELKIYT